MFLRCIDGPMQGTVIDVTGYKPGDRIMVRGKIAPLEADEPIFHPMSNEATKRIIAPIFIYQYDKSFCLTYIEA